MLRQKEYLLIVSTLTYEIGILIKCFSMVDNNSFIRIGFEK